MQTTISPLDNPSIYPSEVDVGAGGRVFTSLDNKQQKWRNSLSKVKNKKWLSPKQRRLYQRIMSGLELAFAMKNNVRFLTLTSQDHDSPQFHTDFRRLVKRLRYHYNRFDYICVKEFTKRGYPHYHILYRGCYIPQSVVSSIWNEIHGSPIVDIRFVRSKKSEIACYLAKYLCDGSRYGWSWNWVYVGFVAKWKWFKRWFNDRALELWKAHLCYYAVSLMQRSLVDYG